MMIDDNFTSQVMNLINQIFQKFQRVCSGGLFILHGLVVGGQLIEQLEQGQNKQLYGLFCQMLNFLQTAMTQIDKTDDMGTRVSCGIISDFCSHLPSLIIQDENSLQALIQACLNVLENHDVE